MRTPFRAEPSARKADRRWEQIHRGIATQTRLAKARATADPISQSVAISQDYQNFILGLEVRCQARCTPVREDVEADTGRDESIPAGLLHLLKTLGCLGQRSRACSHYLNVSTISARFRNPRKSTSSFSNREEIWRNPLSLRKSRSISLRFLFSARSWAHGSTRDWIWAEPPGSCPNRTRVGVFRHPRRHEPSAWGGLPACVVAATAVLVLRAHRARCQETERRLLPFAHLRQPYESWCSIRPGSFRWPVVRFV